MSIISLAKVFPKETGEILDLISEILSHIPSASKHSQDSADLINDNLMSILELGCLMSDKFKIEDYHPDTHALLVKEIRRYRFFLESLDECKWICVDPNIGLKIDGSHIRDLQDIEVILGLLRDEIEKDNC
jgi:hypothetical protein